MSKKIRIGLVSRTLTLRDEVPTYQKAPYVPRDIVTILGELGALPIVFPDVEGASGKDYVDLADALFLPGGQDVDPTLFGEEPTWKVGGADYKMDRFEIDLIRAFYEAGKPIFGICRGIQVLNIALGGTVYQDLQAGLPQCLHRPQPKSLRGLSRPPCKCQERQLAPCGLGGYGLCKLSASSGLEGCSQGSCCYGYGTGWCH